MSIMGNINYDMHKAEMAQPEWIKSERYEYCEDFYDAFKTDNRKALRRFFNRLFSIVF